MDSADRQHVLETSAASLARDAAACALAAGQADRAVELLEQGRGIWWSQVLDGRTDMTALARVAPDLAREIRQTRAVLEQSGSEFAGQSVVTGSAPGRRSAVDISTAAARRFEELVERVRALPPSAEFPYPAEFLRPPSITTLRPPEGQDPVVIVNVSRWRCDAIVVTDHDTSVVELSGLSEDAVVEAANEYLRALYTFEEESAVEALTMLEDTINATLAWLWNLVVEPVLRVLDHLRVPNGDRWPRIWWCPTGPVTLLPLHAAGRHHAPGENALDLVVSSYAPTLRGLARARETALPTAQPRLLVVALANTPGQRVLPGAQRETELLSSLVEPERRTVLADGAATRIAILEQLPVHRWLHASCHGTQSMQNPADGGLVPYDWAEAGMVDVRNLVGIDQASGEFAFLSACKTATGGVSTPDEAVSLASAMHHLGWVHVIGTLWTVWDRSAVAVAERMYSQIIRDGVVMAAESATALHRSLRLIRDRHPDRPSRWVPFVHAGP
jgi:hypothetical protein